MDLNKEIDASLSDIQNIAELVSYMEWDSNCLFDMMDKDFSDYNIQLDCYNHTLVPGHSTGHFDTTDESAPVIAISLEHNQDLVLSTLIHEYSHAQQWIENYKPWVEGAEGQYWEIWNDWDTSRGEKVYCDRIRGHIINRVIPTIKKVERNAEKRSLRMIKAHNLPISRRWYMKRANSYIAFYDVVALVRRFYTSSVYTSETILGLVPDDKLIRGLEDLDFPEEFIYNCIKECM